MIGWLNGCMHRWMDDRGTHGCMDGRMDVWMNGWISTWMKDYQNA